MKDIVHHSALVTGVMALALVWPGCTRNEVVEENDQIVGSGRLISEMRSVSPFTGIRVVNFGKVFITQDTVSTLRIEADDNILDRVETSVTNGQLIVGLRQGTYNNVTLNVTASMRDIRSLESVGAADFRTLAPVHLDSIDCRITGAGSVSLAGTANVESVEITGAGDVHNFGLVASYCFASISGTGTIEVTATQQLDAVIAGAGTIVYAGNPPIVHQSITGVGSIRPGP